MKIDIKIIEEIYRYRQINNYISEQELPPPPSGEGELPMPGGEGLPPTDALPTDLATPPAGPEGATGTTAPVPVDIENDPDVEKVDDEKEGGKGEREEIEVTDLVKGQKNVEDKQDDYFNNLFTHLSDLENKLSAMDQIIDKLNNIETKIEKYREKTPQEKLELRSLDSGPFNQKLSQFFQDKEEEMEKSGKNEYVLTPDEIESYSPHEIKRSFRNFDEDEMTPENDMSKFKKIY